MSKIPNLNSKINYIDWYGAYVQPSIDLVVNSGDITDFVSQISGLFSGVAAVYIGSDQTPHQISYAPFNSSYNGFLPVGTVPNNVYAIDPEQDIFSMQPLIDYITAYNDLATYRTPTPMPSTPIPLKYLDFTTYTSYTRAYQRLIEFFNLFPPSSIGISQYSVLLYKYARDQASLRIKLNCIYKKLIDPIYASNFIEYYNDLVLYYPQTDSYSVGNTAAGLYALSRFVAFNARQSGQRRSYIPR